MASPVFHVPPDPSSRRISPRHVIGFGLFIFVVGAFTVTILPESFQNLTNATYLPLAHSFQQQSRLIWLHAISDSLIGAAYLGISVMIGVLVYRARRDLPFSWLFISFALFLATCGASHFISAMTIWSPLYWLSGDVKLITAFASVATAVVMPPLIPRTIRLVKEAKASKESKHRLEQAHIELEDLLSRLRDYDELKTRFFANVSHDLRTPLTLILGPTEKLLRSHGLTESERKSLETIHHNARLLLVHVNDLLDISRLDAGKLDPSYQATDLAKTVRFSASFFETVANDKKIKYKVEAPETLAAEIDTEKIQRVILNLLSNAFRFAPADGIVRVTLTNREMTGIIEVADSGPGIPPQMREAVFERYRQMPQDVNRANLGTGLGLAIAKDFVNLHQGSITVSAAPEGGALFRVQLPLLAPGGARFGRVDAQSHGRAASAVVEEVRPEPVEQKPTSIATGSSRPSVLVVEDNADMRAFIISTLEHEYRVLTARNGREGLDKAKADAPDLILSDIMMPIMTGDELLEELQKNDELASIPVILISARADEKWRINLLRKGVQDYITKPFSADELLARVGNLVTTKRVRDLLRRELASRSSSVEQLAHEIAARNRDLQSALDGLRRSETRFRRFSESGVVGVIRTDTRGGIFDANDAFLAMLGYSREEMLNGQLRWDEITPHEWEETDRRAIDYLLRTGHIVPFEKEYFSKDGRRIPVLIGAAIVDPEASESLVLVLDLSERKRAELALRNSEKLATIGRLAGSIAHEINNPLDAVSNLLFLIQNDQQLTPVSREYVRLANEEITRVIQICRQMLGFYRETSAPVSVDLKSVLENVMALYSRKIKLQNTRVETRFRFHGTVLGFPGEMRQLFSNLFVNALEATGVNGRVVMRTHPATDWQNPDRSGVRIYLHDDGPGIDPTVLANIFDPFFTTKGEKGTGLGLWVSRGIIEKHGGSVRVRTSTVPGRSGTCFSVFLPFDVSNSEAQQPELRLPA